MRRIVLELIAVAVVFGCGMWYSGHLGISIVYAADDRAYYTMLMHQNVTDEDDQ